MTKHTIANFSLIALLLIGAHVLSAQRLATLNIAVSDPSGRVLSGSRVEMKSVDTGVLRSQVTDPTGQAVLTALTAGDYSLTVSADGFSAYLRSLTISVGQIASISAQLDLATVKQSVSVTEASTAVETEKTEASQVIHPRQIEDLPIAGRDFIDLVLLTPTANVGRSTATAAQSPFLETVLQLSFGGLRETHASFFGLDGTDYTVSLCVAVDLSAQPSAANFQSQQFRSSLAEVLHARFDDFAEVKAGGAVIQLPGMSCSLSSHEKIASYLCSAPASSRPEAEKLYNSLTATLTASLPGYPLCPKPAKADDLKVTRFCHYPTISIADAPVRIEKNLVSLEVFGREAGDRGEPTGFLHGFSLAELGRHADALKALEPILGPGIARRIYEQERFAYDAAVQATQDCPTEQNCAAAEF